MNKVKEMVANFPIRIGIVIRFISDFFFTIGFRLHITFNTESGKKLQRIEQQTRELMQHIKGAIPTTATPPKQSNKLFNAVKGDNG